MNFLNFNNAIINIRDVNKISIQNNKIYILTNGKQYEYNVTEEEAKNIAIELHEKFDTTNNITINANVIDTLYQ